MDVLTTPATTMKPRLWLFQYLNSLASYLTLALAIAVGSGRAESTDRLCVHAAPHFTSDPCLVLNDLAHSLPWKFLSLHQSPGHDSIIKTVYSVKY